MFVLTGNTLQDTWLIALLVLWAALLFGGFIFGRPNAEGTHRVPRWARMASSFVLVLAGWSWYAFTQSQPTHIYSLLIAIGMSFGWLGDLFMAKLILKQDNHILGGIGAFALCHVAYIIGILRWSDHSALTDPAARWTALIIWLLIGLVGWFIVVFWRNKITVLHLAALPYTLLLSSTTGLSWGLFVQDSHYWPVAIGAALFLFSDLVLAVGLFRENVRIPLSGDIVWLTCGPGQMLIVYSVASALSATL